MRIGTFCSLVQKNSHFCFHCSIFLHVFVIFFTASRFSPNIRPYFSQLQLSPFAFFDFRFCTICCLACTHFSAFAHVFLTTPMLFWCFFNCSTLFSSNPHQVAPGFWALARFLLAIFSAKSHDCFTVFLVLFCNVLLRITRCFFRVCAYLPHCSMFLLSIPCFIFFPAQVVSPNFNIGTLFCLLQVVSAHSHHCFTAHVHVYMSLCTHCCMSRFLLHPGYFSLLHVFSEYLQVFVFFLRIRTFFFICTGISQFFSDTFFHEHVIQHLFHTIGHWHILLNFVILPIHTFFSLLHVLPAYLSVFGIFSLCMRTFFTAPGCFKQSSEPRKTLNLVQQIPL